MSEILKFENAFKEAVLDHVTRKLSTDEWKRLRARSGGDAGLNHEAIIDAGLAEQNLSVDENLTTEFKPKASPIAFVGDQPVWYVAGAGFYVWSISPTHPFALCVWLTHPAYPEGW
ncbi:MAG: hypothetical protein RLY95_1560 [Pseudomonadota bacterium]|jgi:hypothetical protein